MVNIVEETPVVESIEESLGQGEEEQPQAEEESQEAEDNKETETEQTEDSGEITVSIGDQEPEEEETQEAPQWVKDLRKRHKEAVRKNQQYEKKLKELETQDNVPVVDPGEKPTISGCDYDEDLYSKRIDEWYQRKAKADQYQQQVQEQRRQQDAQWQQSLKNYEEKKNALRVKDYDAAELNVVDNLSKQQQLMIVQGADNPALVVYALGKNPGKAKELASINDHIKFAFAVSKLEASLKVSGKQKNKIKPEKRVTGTGSLTGTTDGTLDRLRREAEKSGDYSKVAEYRRQKRRA